MAEMTYAVHTGTCTYLLDDEGICLWTLSPGGNAGSTTDRCVGAQFVACLDLSAPGGLVGELRIGASALFVRREHGKFVLLRTMAIERVEYREQTDEEAHAHREVLSAQDATAVLTDEIARPQAPAEDPQTPDPATPLRAPPPPPPRAPDPPYRTDARGPETEPLPAQALAWALQQAEAMRARPPPEPWEVPGAAVAPPRWDASQAMAGGMPLPHLAYEEPENAAELDAEELVSISVTEVTLTMPLYRPPPGAVQPPAPPPRVPPPHAPPVRREASSAYVLPPPATPPRRASSFPPPPQEHSSGDAGPPTPRGPPPARPAVVDPGRRLR